MRSKLVLAVALCLALAVPASALGAAPATTSKGDSAVAYFTHGTDCLILTLADGQVRQVGGDVIYGAALVVQWSTVSGFPACPPATNPSDVVAVTLDSTNQRIIGLDAAYVDSPTFTLRSHHLTVDVAWVAVGDQEFCPEDHDSYRWVAHCVNAHLTGTITDDVQGYTWTGDPGSAMLRSSSVGINY